MWADTTQAQPHHYWWASIAQQALTYLRPFIKLSGTQDEAWQTVVRVLSDL